MGVIKAQNAPSASLAPFSMKDIETHARGLILRARKQAEELLAAAQAEAELLKKEAQAQGAEAGRKEGLAKGTEEGKKLGQQQALNEQKAALTTVVKSLTTASKEFNDSRRKLEADGLFEVIQLAIGIARRVTKQQGIIDPLVLQSNISEAMKLVVHTSDLRISIHPAQKSALMAALPQLKLEWPTLEHVELIEDSTLAPGGCRIFTRGGQVDADLDQQLDRIVADLLPSTQEAVA